MNDSNKNHGRAAEGVHTLVYSILSSLNLPKDAALLDMGAGEGVLTKLMLSLDFTNIEALEVVAGRFRVPGITCHNLDLNSPRMVSDLGKKFDVVFAVEIVEHVENPTKFFRDVSRIVNPGGYIILSSPNVTSWYSRIQFLRHGDLDWFNARRYRKDGHIHPLFEWQVECMCGRFNLKVLKILTSDNSFLLRKRFSRGLFKTPLRPFTYARLFLQPLMKGHIGGENKLWVLSKPGEPDQEEA